VGGTNTDFLTGLYDKGLKRSVDPLGMAVWGADLDHGAPRVAIAQAVLESKEASGLVVLQFYLNYLDRPPEPLGAAYWVDVLLHGGTQEQVLQGIIGSKEYYTRF
jgi:hypothetical protein